MQPICTSKLKSQNVGPLHDQIQSALSYLASSCSTDVGFGSMTPSIYDTAWLSMLQKPTLEEGTSQRDKPWLFPQCFDYVLQQQLADGSWEVYSSPVDGILNTAASLLAVRRHMKVPSQRNNLQWRAIAAEAALRRMLESWDVDATDQVGFEVLIWKHLSLLEEDGVAIELDASNSPSLSRLRTLRSAKMAKLPVAMIYATPSTCLHSLEGFIGDLDFDRLACWRDDNGSMMGSPASTAAYLMHASMWDDRAEAYLRATLAFGSGQGDGSVPCAWPTTIFELTWVSPWLLFVHISGHN